MGKHSYCFHFMYSPYRVVILPDDDVPDWWSQRGHTLASHQKTESLATAERPLTLTADLAIATSCSLCVVQSIFTEVVSFFYLLFFLFVRLQCMLLYSGIRKSHLHQTTIEEEKKKDLHSE